MRRNLMFIAALLAGSASYAQRSNISVQERVQADYARDHYTTSSGEHVDISRDNSGNLKEVRTSWTSANGDRNTQIKDANGKVTSIVDHPNGSREVNGVPKGDNGGTNVGGRSEGNDRKGNEGGSGVGNGRSGDGGGTGDKGGNGRSEGNDHPRIDHEHTDRN